MDLATLNRVFEIIPIEWRQRGRQFRIVSSLDDVLVVVDNTVFVVDLDAGVLRPELPQSPSSYSSPTPPSSDSGRATRRRITLAPALIIGCRRFSRRAPRRRVNHRSCRTRRT